MRSWCSIDGDVDVDVGDDDEIEVDVEFVDFAYGFKLFKLLLLKFSELFVVIKLLSFWCELLILIPFSLTKFDFKVFVIFFSVFLYRQMIKKK